MTSEFGVPDYITEEELNLRSAASSGEATRHAAEERNRLIADIGSKVALARSSNLPRDCVIETVVTRRKGFMFSVEYEHVESTEPAFFLGSAIVGYKPAASMYDGTIIIRQQFAITPVGMVYANDQGVGERKEFRIGEGAVMKIDGTRGLGGPVMRIPDDLTYLRGFASLPGWSKFGNPTASEE